MRNSLRSLIISHSSKLDYEDYESDEGGDDEANEMEEQDSDNESFHEALENLALEEKRQIAATA